MALIQVNFFSKKLMRTVPINVILPVDKMSPDKETDKKEFKTLYLLHGILGNYTDWISNTRIARLAEENDLAVVMPSGDNAFYVDQPKGNNYYGEFIGEELVELTRKMFPLSHRREDTFIGGLSMGGYGAMRNGLKYYNTFGYIVALSGVLLLDDIVNSTNEAKDFINSRDYAESCFGNLDEVLNSDKNPQYLIKKLKQSNADMPKMYIACGTEDSLFNINQSFVTFLQDNNVNAKFEIGPGSHNWEFWDEYIEKAINWLPTENSGLGINSGNIGVE